jgi:hypothetical protein
MYIFFSGNALKETFLPYLFTVKNHNTVWGLSSILKVVNPPALSKYKWLLDDLTPHPEDVLSSGDYTVGNKYCTYIDFLNVILIYFYFG